METNVIIKGDALEVLKTIPDNSIDSVVTDPPYGLAFMNKEWDNFKNNAHYAEWCEKWARECLRVLKPGGHLLAFGGTRTYHALAWGIEQAGFEIRDMIEWLYTSGFPKSMDVSKALDKYERGKLITAKIRYFREKRELTREQLASLLGVGANNVWDWEVGGHAPSDRWWNEVKTKLNVTDEEERQFEREKIAERIKLDSFVRDGGYVAGEADSTHYERKVIDITAPATPLAKKWAGWGTALKPAHEPIVMARKPLEKNVCYTLEKYGTGAINVDGCRIQEEKRFPANCVTLDENDWYSKYFNVTPREISKKATKKDRGEYNTHPTVKPTALMAWLIRLVTPPGGIVLDPFAGSGSTLVAAVREGFRFIGIELEPKYVEIAERRLGEEVGVLV